MFCSSFLNHYPTILGPKIFKNHQKKPELKICRRSTLTPTQFSWSSAQVLQKSVPLAASLAILLWSNPAIAGFLSGSKGLESIPGPQLPQFDFLTKLNEENQKKYAELDSRFKSSPVIKELLEKSKLNKEKNRKEVQDKYCIRGAEWGVGDCSTQGMTQEEKDTFIAMLKKKAGVE
eukprot:TRINITY_DN2956_c0_g1_i1.p1 TRINITY_DN2956_c0_g1~~TRINITY_DN2956_c0_g1_i1.p1  ORF type:complete len:176 (+),score=31.93 TRINITY_DN2956_c0_g1_i1:110-637(+)